ncbi:MAG: hypothetical protein V3U02_12675 [Calditrichia bacterium]
MKEDTKNILVGACIVGLILGLIASLFIVLPIWNVWRAGLSGEASLVKAEQTKKIMIETARAEKESARLRADAIEIMGKAAKDFPEYRKQEFMGAFADALREGNVAQIIYVPTEASIPILEAGKR